MKYRSVEVEYFMTILSHEVMNGADMHEKNGCDIKIVHFLLLPEAIFFSLGYVLVHLLCITVPYKKISPFFFGIILFSQPSKPHYILVRES